MVVERTAEEAGPAERIDHFTRATQQRRKAVELVPQLTTALRSLPTCVAVAFALAAANVVAALWQIGYGTLVSSPNRAVVDAVYAIGLLSTALTVVAVLWWRRPQPLRPLIMIGMAHVWWAGIDVMETFVGDHWALQIGYLAGYMPLLIGVLAVAAQWSAGRISWFLVDAGLTAVAIMTVVGGLLLPNSIHTIMADGLDTGQRWLAYSDLTFPLLDALILGIALRVLATANQFRAAMSWLALAMTLTAAGDVLWQIATASKADPTANAIAMAVWHLAYASGAVAIAVAPTCPVAARSGKPFRVNRVGETLLITGCLLGPPALVLTMPNVRTGLALIIIQIGAATMALLVAARMAQMLRLADQHSRAVTELSLRDPLTHLANRRFLDQTLDAAVTQARAQQRQLSIIMLDLDHFKRFNDTHGHQRGDDLLVEVAQMWQERVPATSLVARFGGEEFLVVLPATHGEVEAAQAVAAGLIRELPLQQTCSAGVAQWQPGMAPVDLIRAADQALYAAKQMGRNQVRKYTPPDESALDADVLSRSG